MLGLLRLGLRRKVRGLTGVDVYVAPPFTLLPGIVKTVLESSPVKVGAQTISPTATANTPAMSLARCSKTQAHSL
jgi:triosephosphate isomerase